MKEIVIICVKLLGELELDYFDYFYVINIFRGDNICFLKRYLGLRAFQVVEVVRIKVQRGEKVGCLQVIVSKLEVF